MRSRVRLGLALCGYFAPLSGALLQQHTLKADQQQFAKVYGLRGRGV